MEGIRIAIEKGVKFGRPILEKPVDFENIARKYRDNQLTSRETANLLNVSQTTFLKWIKNKGASLHPY